MEKCSELVMRLHGSEATEGMFDLVFGRNIGKWLPPIYFHRGIPGASFIVRSLSSKIDVTKAGVRNSRAYRV